MNLSTHTLKHHLHDSALIDWIHLHAKQWLRQHPDVFEKVYGSAEQAEAFHRQVELTTIHKNLESDYIPELPIQTFSTFYEHVLNHCCAKDIPPPHRLNHSVFASAPHTIDQQHNTYVIVEAVQLGATFAVDNTDVTLTVRPDMLLSRPLATLLFHDKLPKKCTHTVFSRWVPVCLTSSGKAGLITHNARTTKYEAMQFQACQHALHQWTTDARKEPNVSCVGGVVLNTSSLSNSKFYVHHPQPLILTKQGQMQTKPYEWLSALEWAVRVRQHGQLWDPIEDRVHLELCTPASLGGLSDEWHPFVHWLAQERRDMCLVYKIGATVREKAWKRGVHAYEEVWDQQASLQSLKLNPLSLQIIWANHRSNPEKQMVVPRRLGTPEHRALVQHSRQHPYFIVDFETIRSDWIFMVATVYYNPITCERTVFTEHMHHLTMEEQVGMLHRWVARMNALIPADQNPHLFHWSPAEPQFLRTLFTKHPALLQQLHGQHPTTAHTLTTNGALRWTDLCAVFLKEPITVPTCFDFQLKHIIRALVRIGLLRANNVWEEGGVQDGRAAMALAERAYRESTPSVFEDIQRYNEADVLVLQDVLVEVLWKMV